jgi:hypothetical protein
MERYLSGQLPAKGAAEFERFCRDNPGFLTESGMADRVQVGMELLVAIGLVPPARTPFLQRPQVVVWMIVVILLLSAALWGLINLSSFRADKISQLQEKYAKRPLDMTTSTREIRLLPSRDGGTATPAIVIGGHAAELAEFRIDETRSPYKVFRVTIDRINQGRVGVISNLLKDANGHLRISVNSTALGPGDYQFTVEGLLPNGDAEPDSWVTIGIQP